MAFKEGSIIGPASYNATGSSNTVIGTGSNSGTVSIGNTSSGAITIDCGTAGINVGTTGNAHSSVLGSTSSTSATTVQCGSGGLVVTSTGGALNVTSGTGVMAISSDSSATTVNIGTGSAIKTVTLGSTSTTSTTNLQAGSGGIKIPAFGAGALLTDTTGKLLIDTGTAGQVLTANTAAAPSFQTVSGGSSVYVLLSTVTFSSPTASVNFDNTLITSTYSNYLLVIHHLRASSASKVMAVRYSTDNGGTFLSLVGSSLSNIYGSNTYTRSTGSGGLNPANSQEVQEAYVYLYNLGASAVPALVARAAIVNGVYTTSTSNWVCTTTETVNYVRIDANGGATNMASGTIYLYGIKQS